MRPEFRGPLGRRLLPDTAAGSGDGPRAPSPDPGPVHPAPVTLTDQHRVMMLDHFMRQSGVRTAVVLSHAEESLRYDRADRALAGALAGWAEHSDDHNLCVLLFRKHTLKRCSSSSPTCAASRGWRATCTTSGSAPPAAPPRRSAIRTQRNWTGSSMSRGSGTD